MTDAARRTAALNAAARARSKAKTTAAEQAIRALVKRGEAITFQSVGREADVSHAFLYNHPDLRARIEHLRAQSKPSPPPSAPPTDESMLVTALTRQISELKRQHRTETQALREALERAHGENLDLRRELARRGSTGVSSGTPALALLIQRRCQYSSSRRSTIRRNSRELRWDIAPMTISRISRASQGDPQHSKIPQPPSGYSTHNRR